MLVSLSRSGRTVRAGTAIGTIQGSDASGILQNWIITSDPSNGAFALNATTGALTVNNTNLLNQQAGQTVTLQVRVSDGLNTSAVTSVQVAVVPVNVAPTLDLIGNVRFCATTTAQSITLTGASAVEPSQTYSFRVIANQDYFDDLNVSNSWCIAVPFEKRSAKRTSHYHRDDPG